MILEKFKIAKAQFLKDQQGDEGNKVMQKVIEQVNYLGQNFRTLDGSELSEIQMKLAGYKFYLADYLYELYENFQAIEATMKEFKASRWDEVSEEIKSVDGKVKNKEQIENRLIMESRDMLNMKILYETQHHKYKLKISSIDDILTAVVQRIAQLKKEVEQSRQI